MISSAIVSCSEPDAGEAQQGMQKFAIDTLYTHVNYETDDLARPVSIDLLPDGQLAVLDNQLKQIRLYDTDGSLVRSMGRGGEGPGEFERPAYIHGADTAVWVTDHSSKFVAYAPGGELLKEFLFQSEALMKEAIPTGTDRYIALAGGEEGSMIKLGLAGSDSARFFGEGFERENAVNLAEANQEARREQIPAMFRNLADIRYDGEAIYLFLSSYHILRKYSPDGELLWETDVDIPVNRVIFDEFVEDNSGDTGGAVYILQYIMDLRVRNGNTYILWRKMGDYPQQIVKVNREGRIEATFMLPEMEDLFLNSLAVSEDESTVYLGSSGTATIYRATLATTHREQTGTD